METVRELVARVLKVGIDEVTDDSSPQTIESWDSFNGLMLTSELEKNFKVKFTMDEVLRVSCVKDIKDALRRHGVEKGVD